MTQKGIKVLNIVLIVFFLAFIIVFCGVVFVKNIDSRTPEEEKALIEKAINDAQRMADSLESLEQHYYYENHKEEN